jgi:hypothetical protein
VASYLTRVAQVKDELETSRLIVGVHIPQGIHQRVGGFREVCGREIEAPRLEHTMG